MNQITIELWNGKYKGIELEFSFQDLWIGVHWQILSAGKYKKQTSVWICAIPTLPIRIWWVH
jgi:hypothetical protein